MDIPQEDWVNRRASCTLEDMFASLKEQVKGDVQKYNKSNPRLIRAVELTSENDTGFTVKDYDSHAEIAAFAITDAKTIGVLPAAETQFDIKYSWNQKLAVCELAINGEVVELWQISQRALIGKFFG